MAHILIAEDDSSMRHFLTMALRQAGHSVESCPDGLTALQTLADGLSGDTPFDLLLTDIIMPGMDGIELSQKAARIAPGVKIMFMSGFTAMALAQKDAIPDPAAKILAKPFHLKDLVDQINHILAG